MVCNDLVLRELALDGKIQLHSQAPAVLKAMTLMGAYGLYMEDEFGSLEVGKRATFIVLNQNLFEIPAAD